MVLVGGGVIGLEMGSVWSRLGAKVTVVEFLDRICPGMDLELTKMFQKTLKSQGFEFRLQQKVTATEVTDDGVKVTVEPSAGGEAEILDADVVLVSTGRRPYTDKLGLDKLGIPTNKFGQIEVDESFRTVVPSVYAIGDCIPGPMLAHKAEEEGIAAVETIAGMAGHVNYDAIPGVLHVPRNRVGWQDGGGAEGGGRRLQEGHVSIFGQLARGRTRTRKGWSSFFLTRKRTGFWGSTSWGPTRAR